MADLFDTLNDDQQTGFNAEVSQRAPLAVRMRPRTLNEVVGQKKILKPGSPLRVLAGEGSSLAGPSSVILWGPPGVGKTTLANVIARSSGSKFVELSAITAGVKDVRAVMDQALLDRDLHGVVTVLFLDEIHRFSKAQQDALLPGVENRWVVLVAATTENPSFSVISPLLSRSILVTLESLSHEDLVELVDRALADRRGFAGRVSIEDAARQVLVERSGGDARKVLTSLEAAVAVASGTDGEEPVVKVSHVEEALDHSAVRYDRSGDQHYDVVSAFIKSIRGSDVDAALHYLARMLEGGEDPRFIARRLMISASEDIGMADSQALSVATAAAQSVALVGMPEGRIILGHATVYLASAPKSNAAYLGINRAIADVRAGHYGAVPKHLRDGHYGGSARLGHGVGYKYPHDEPLGVSRQQYAPDELVETIYYEPTVFGAERAIGERLAKIRRLVRGSERE